MKELATTTDLTKALSRVDLDDLTSDHTVVAGPNKYDDDIVVAGFIIPVCHIIMKKARENINKSLKHEEYVNTLIL